MKTKKVGKKKEKGKKLNAKEKYLPIMRLTKMFHHFPMKQYR